MSIVLLLLFPLIILGMIWVFLMVVSYLGNGYYDDYGNFVNQVSLEQVNYYFLQTLPWVVGGVGLWFCIAYFANTSMIRHATGARPLERRENPRIYNIVENLCMTCGMDMPKINIVDDEQLNAFASGIDKNSYTVTVTTGLANRLDDAELAGVIGHELTHIRNRDTRLLITSIIFVGIVSTVMSLSARLMNNVMVFGRYRFETLKRLDPACERLEELAEVTHADGFLLIAHGERAFSHEFHLRCDEDFVLQLACDVLLELYQLLIVVGEEGVEFHFNGHDVGIALGLDGDQVVGGELLELQQNYLKSLDLFHYLQS